MLRRPGSPSGDTGLWQAPERIRSPLLPWKSDLLPTLNILLALCHFTLSRPQFLLGQWPKSRTTLLTQPRAEIVTDLLVGKRQLTVIHLKVTVGSEAGACTATPIPSASTTKGRAQPLPPHGYGKLGQG